MAFYLFLLFFGVSIVFGSDFVINCNYADNRCTSKLNNDIRIEMKVRFYENTYLSISSGHLKWAPKYSGRFKLHLLFFFLQSKIVIFSNF